jgi:GGDEF domain-containing protein
MICERYKHSPVYRTGGDEFVVLVLNKDYEQREGLLAALNRCSEDNINTGKAVVAAGMAELESGDKQAEEVFKRADQRMYEHKKYLKSLGARMRD